LSGCPVYRLTNWPAAVQIRFVTRQGSNELHGSLYWYHRNPALNSNYWFNNPPAADPQTAASLS
jgi:hypothetical protein